MAAPTTTRNRKRTADDDEITSSASANSDPESDEDDDDEPQPQRPAGRASAAAAQVAADDWDEDPDDDDDDDAIIIGEGWDDAEEPEDGVFPTVERGVYVIMLAEAETRTAGEKAKNPGMKFGSATFKIMAEDNPSTMEDEQATVTVWQSFFFTKASYGRTKRDFKRMGIELAVGQNAMVPLIEMADPEDGARFEAVIKKKSYRAEDEETGKKVTRYRNEIARILRPTDI